MFHLVYQRIFSSKDFNSIRDYVIRNGIIKNANLTISSFSTEQIQISIYSGLNLNLCNKELLDIGLKQLRESLVRIDIPFVDKFLFEAKVRYEILNSDTSVEIGNPIRKPTTLKEIKKHWVIAKVYNLKDIVKFWIDTSRSNFDKLNPFEMDFKFKIKLSSLFRIIKFIDNLPYLIRIVKEIERYKKLLETYNKLKLEQKNYKVNTNQAFEITPSNLEITRLKNDFLLGYKIFNEINELYGYRYRSKQTSYIKT